MPVASPESITPAAGTPGDGGATQRQQPTEEPTAPPSHHGFLRHARLIGILTLISRILGMARESVAALYFGAGVVWSAFTVAFTVPNLFRKLFGEGALSAAFIPLYAQALKTGNEKEARQFAAASVNLLCLILLGLTVVGEAGLWLADLWLRNSRPDLILTIKLTAIMLLYVLLICGTAFLGAILQVHRRFALPAAAPVLLNIIHIVVIVAGAAILGMRSATGLRRIELETTLVNWLAVFVLVAGVLQVAMLLPSLKAVGFRFDSRARIWTPAVRKMLILSVPVGLSAGVLQLSVLIDKGITVALSQGADGAGNLVTHFSFAGRLVEFPMKLGAVARLNWAQFLYQFPLGVFAIAIATAIFPGLSADALDHDRARFRRVLNHGIVATLLEGFPASLGLILVRYPAIRVFFQHGSFTADDTRWVALSVVFYSAAIWAFSVQQILNRAYYAMHDTMTPLILAIVTIVVNTIVEVPLVFSSLGEAGMAAGTLASFGLQAIVMLIMLDKRVGGLGLRQIGISVVKMLAACGAMALVCFALEKSPWYPRGTGMGASLLQLAMLMTVGGISYLLACQSMGLDVLAHLTRSGLEATASGQGDDAV